MGQVREPGRVGFGLFLSSRPERDPVGAARHAEELGFDMVTFADHLSGRSPSLETWTLMAWTAAATERVRVSSNVLGLPYRHPAVLAKMAESLQRLSGGRLVLGMGAGARNSVFESLGLAARSPGEKVEALEEALRIMKGMWSEERFSLQGTQFRVEDAQITPKPDPPPPIWLGVYGERMLEVCGRLADGWIPSRVFLEPEKAYEKLKQVRSAAEDAGRDPDDLTYAYNVWVRIEEGAEAKDGQVAGSADQVAETCARFLEGGFTHLNFSTDGDPEEQRELLASEVVSFLGTA